MSVFIAVLLISAGVCWRGEKLDVIAKILAFSVFVLHRRQ
ncbi:hypothetical protein BVG79_01654 [Ketogulonicigenium robustum]|uniref:Uncharacterized protein n=1 Tax=Ketogulonicigenium robustum TaxID=92947 RepID=A0A1W6P0G8_9RHOB|nr:hypothetical protein BVG79_01654 [Ketogulonicigenium robustum]